jgi:hypothetical protein
MEKTLTINPNENDLEYTLCKILEIKHQGEKLKALKSLYSICFEYLKEGCLDNEVAVKISDKILYHAKLIDSNFNVKPY